MNKFASLNRLRVWCAMQKSVIAILTTGSNYTCI